jgi:putative DNA primase/helicase
MTMYSDWNDLHCASGLAEVRRQFMAAVAAATPASVEQLSSDTSHAEAAPEQEQAKAEKPKRKRKFTGDWHDLLSYNAQGNLVAHANNVITILQNDPRCKDLLVFNEFSLRIEKTRAPEWGGGVGAWTDSDDLKLMYWLGRQYGLNVKDEACAKATKKVGDECPIHPVRTFLRGLAWDGTPRLKSWLHTYLGCDDTPYTQAVGLKWLVSAVARVMRPGCKADGVLILYGKQGKGKSTALSVLFGEWFMDTPIPIGQKDAYEAIRGRWGIELGELDALNKVEATAAKTFFSSSEDTYRPSYGRHAVTSPRQCVFAGTTNHAVHLKDSTGNRRFWSVSVGAIDLEALRRDREQIWAEAVASFEAKYAWWVLSDEHAMFDAEQEVRRLTDPWEDPILTWLESNDIRSTTDFKSEDFLLTCLKVPAERMTAQMQSRVVAILERNGFTRVRLPRDSSSGKRGGYVFRRPPPDNSLGCAA